MQSKNRLRLYIIATISLLLIIACTVYYFKSDLRETGPTAESLENVDFRLKWFKYSSFAHHFVAEKMRIYQKNGLKVAINEGGVGIDPIMSVVSGLDDIGLASYAQILIARERGIPVVAIAEEYTQSGAISFSLKESAISKPEDLIGKKVGVIPGSDTYTVYAALMAKLGIDRKNIIEVNVGFDIKPLLAGTIDATTAAFITNQPIYAEEQGYEVAIIDPHDYDIRTGGNVFFTTEDNLKNKREMLKLFLLSSVEAIIASQRMDDSTVVDIVLQQNPQLNRDAELKIWAATKRHLLQSNPELVGKMSEETWNKTASIFYEYDLLQEKPDIGNAFTNKLIDEIHSEYNFRG